jgi:hypothetical protein
MGFTVGQENWDGEGMKTGRGTRYAKGAEPSGVSCIKWRNGEGVQWCEDNCDL